MFWFFGSYAQEIKLRPLADTVGFAHTKAQMESVMRRIMRTQEKKLRNIRLKAGVGLETEFKTVISPHDDYTYTGYMYPLALQNVHAKTVILIGVAHKAKNLGLEDKLIFDSYTHWSGPYGNVKVSSMREEILAWMPKVIDSIPTYEVNDTMQKIEHSLEAQIPFLQYYNKKTFNRNVEIVPILVPYMNYERMEQLAGPLAKAISLVMEKKKLKWGYDVAIVISSDAVHYGNEDWGGKNFAFYGLDSAGYKKAVNHEYEIMNACFDGELTEDKAFKFTRYTVVANDHKDYIWTWCGRYSVPFGLFTSYHLANILGLKKPLMGKILSYETSISNKHIPVIDLGLGVTAPAKLRHWVGYPAIGFK